MRHQSPPEPCARPELTRRASPRHGPHSFDVSPHLIGPASGSAYSVQRSPSAVRLPWGLPADGIPCASARGRQSRARPVLGVSGLGFASRARRHGNSSHGVSSPTTHASTEDPVTPGGSTPRHLPPSGFDYPLDGFLPSAPGSGPSAAAASMGFALQGLAPPGRRYPSRGLASPVVLAGSFRRPPATPEVFSCREGERRAPAQARRPSILALLGVRPSKALSSGALGRLPGPSPSIP